MAEPKGLSETLLQFPGQWVAVDSRTNEPRAAAESPYALAAEVKRQGLKNIAIVRSRDASEPELVGLG